MRIAQAQSMRSIALVALLTALFVLPMTADAQPAPDSTAAPRDSRRSARERYSLWSQSIVETEPIIVEGKEFTVRDVVRRATAGEGTKLAGHRDLTYYYTIRVAIEWPQKRRIETQVYRAYQDSTGYSRLLFLNAKAEQFKKIDDEWTLDEDKDPDEPPFRIEELETSYFTRLPFYLDDDEEFDFKLLKRTLESDRVVFHIAFRPKSDFSPLPSGEVFIDSKNFQVVHEVYEFNQNPFPLALKGVRRASRQWTQLPSGEWVRKRIAMDIELRSMPFAPDNVLITAYFRDFVFDAGYDEHLFGKMKRDALPPASPRAVPADSLVDSPPQLLSDLQREDDAAYPAEAAETEAQFTLDTIARHDSVGLTGIEQEGPALYGTDWQLGANPALRQWDYNRVEGFLFGGEVTFGQADNSLAELSAFGGYATGSEEFRYAVEARAPIPSTDRKLSFAAWYRDRAEPFGSNRIALNSVRAFVGGADDQDYLHRLGGGGKFVFDPSDALRFELGFEAYEVSSIGASTDFSLLGDNLRNDRNPSAVAGDENDVVAGVRIRAPNWLDIDFSFRTSGGALGGDFRFNRSEATVRANRYLVGRHGLDVTLKGVTTGDAPPVQYLADIGGLSTVRGYDRRARVGEHSFAARVEYPVPYDLFALSRIPLLRDTKIQWTPWFDAGRVGDGDSRDWITSAGLGLQRYIGPFGDAANLRLDFAFPLDTAPDDYVISLWFVALR